MRGLWESKALISTSEDLVMKIERRHFLGFFLAGGLLSLLRRHLWGETAAPKRAQFWRKV